MDQEIAAELNAQIEAATHKLDADDIEGALALLNSVVARGQGANAWGPVASAHGLMAQVLIRCDRRAEARPHAEAGLAIARQVDQQDAVEFFEQLVQLIDSGADLPSADLEAQLQASLKMLEGGQVEEAIRTLEQIVEHGDGQREPGLIATAHNFLAQTLGQIGRRDDAMLHARAGLAIAQRVNQQDAVDAFEQLIGHLSGGAPSAAEQIGARVQAAMGALEAGDLDAAEQILEGVISMGPQPDAVGLVVSAHGLMAQVRDRKGDRPGAQEHARKAWELLPAGAPEQIRQHFEGLLTSLGVGLA